MVLELDAPDDPVPGSSRAERFEAMRRGAMAVKQRVLARIEGLRWRDPGMEVLYLHTISPTMIVRSTQEVLSELAHIPGVLSMTLERHAELH